MIQNMYKRDLELNITDEEQEVEVGWDFFTERKLQGASSFTENS